MLPTVLSVPWPWPERRRSKRSFRYASNPSWAHRKVTLLWWVYLIPEKSDVFKVALSAGVSDAFAEASSSWAPDSVHGRTLYRETPWYGAFPDTINGKDPLLSSEGLRAFVILPLFRNRSLAGCFCLASHEHDSVPQSARCDMEALSRWFDKERWPRGSGERKAE